MTELDHFLSKLIPLLKEELGSERTFELLQSICPNDRDSREEVAEIKERLSLRKSEIKNIMKRIQPLKLLKENREYQIVPIISSYAPSGKHPTLH